MTDALDPPVRPAYPARVYPLHRARQLAVLIASALVVARSPAAAALCPGDCDGDGLVQVHEVVQSVDIALGAGAYRFCPPADTNADGRIDTAELIGAVRTALGACPATTDVRRAPEVAAVAGPNENGRGILPNGRRVDPSGDQVPVQTFPLNVALVKDGRFLLVTNDGWGNEEGERGLQIVDVATRAVTQVDVPHFFGLAVAGERVFLADGDGDRIEGLHFQGDVLVRDAEPVAELPPDTFPTGIAVNPSQPALLYVVGLGDNSLWTINTDTGEKLKASVPVGNFPYTVIVSADGRRAYVSSWGLNNGNPPGIPAPLPPINPSTDTRSSVAVLDLANPTDPQLVRYVPIARSLRVDFRTIFGGSHPSAMQLSPDGKLLYVTATNLDVLVVLDAESLDLVAEVPLNVFETAPVAQQLQGLYPNAIAVSGDGHRVYIADSGINAVQVIAADPDARSFVPSGFIPTGWFPSALVLAADDTLFVANGKGAGVGPNGPELIDINLETFSDTPYYIGRLVKGSISVVNDVSSADLAAGTARVRADNGFDPAAVRWVDGEPTSPDEVQRGNPVPIDFGSGPSSKLRHVVFILKENRTYDQVFGDLDTGNRDARLALFGENVTPNHHALAREYAIGDNFYADAEVSIPGHEWTDAGNTNDFTEKLWPRNYNGRLSSNTVQLGQEGFCKGGYIFEALENEGVSYRVYGEAFALLSKYQAGIDGGGPASVLPQILEAFGSIDSVVQNTPKLIDGDIDGLRAAGVDVDLLQEQVWPNLRLGYASNILANKTDVERAQIFLGELAQFEAQGELPSFLFIWLPNDHTFGAAPSMPTPDSAVADNDEGLGKIIAGLTQSSFWKDMAIFITEDDAQDGQDHVSAHRTIGMVISPYVKRGYISGTHQSNVSMLKTMELILGITPRSQFDRYATDMRDYFNPEPDFTRFTARPRQIPAARNSTAEDAPNAYLRRAAEMSADLNLDMYDSAGENLSQVLWLVHKGQQQEAARVRSVRLLGAALTILVATLLFRRRRAGVIPAGPR